MRYFSHLLVVCISAGTLYAADPNGQQPSTSEKQQASKQGTRNPEAYELNFTRSCTMRWCFLSPSMCRQGTSWSAVDLYLLTCFSLAS